MITPELVEMANKVMSPPTSRLPRQWKYDAMPHQVRHISGCVIHADAIPPGLPDPLLEAWLNKTMMNLMAAPGAPQAGFGMSPMVDSHQQDIGAVCMRMRWDKHLGRPTCFSFFEVYRKKDGDRIIFIVSQDKPVTLEDGKELFPSDSLVGRLRLLEGSIGEKK